MKFSNFLFPQSELPEKDEQVIDETLAEAKLCDELSSESPKIMGYVIGTNSHERDCWHKAAPE